MAPLSPGAFKPVKPESLAADPAAAIRKPIALAPARCFSFGVGDNRCLARGSVSVAVAAAVIMPPGAEVAIAQGCTPGAPGSPPGCTLRILFVPVSFHKVQVDGREIVVFQSASVMVPPEKTSRSGPTQP